MPTNRKIRPSATKNRVPPILQINAPTTSPYSQSPKKNIGIPIDRPSRMGRNSTITVIASMRLVPNPSIIRLNLIVSS